MKKLNLFKRTFILVVLFLGVPPLLYAESIWIDVRSKFEHMRDHIKGDPRFTHTEAATKIQDIYPDRNAEISLYCAKGVRAEKVRVELIKAGYKNIVNAGGINDARKLRLLSE